MVFGRAFARVGSAVLLAVMLSISVGAPIAVAADEDPCVSAETAAVGATPGALWFLAGCVGTWVGVAAAYLITPTPPASKLVGKSPEYVAKYSDCYKKKAQGAQTKMAWTGCGVGALAWGALMLLSCAGC